MAAIDLTVVNTTSATKNLVALLDRAGLRPHFGPSGPASYRGVVTVIFDEGGYHGVFGAVLVGTRSGRVVRGEIFHGSDSDPRKFKGYQQAHQVITSLLAVRLAASAAR